MKSEEEMKEETKIMIDAFDSIRLEKSLRIFVKQSWLIEGYDIDGIKLDDAVKEHEVLFFRLKDRDLKSSDAIISFCKEYGGELREKNGQDVMVGNHRPQKGGMLLRAKYNYFCDAINSVKSEDDVVKMHREYEDMHPFTDVNGRSGRAIVYYQMRKISNENSLCLPGSFLHWWYYKTIRK